MNENLTDISIVLDRSGSMSVVKTDTIGGFNDFLKAQKACPGEAVLTLAQFDDKYDIVHNGINIQDVPELNDETFVPRGWTALLDAIGRTINATGARISALPEDARPSKVIFVILTDGQENSSKELTREEVMKMIKHQTKTYKWDFVFLGANQDAIQAGVRMGILANNSMTYAADAKGTQDAFRSVSVNLCSSRIGADMSRGYFTATDREKQKRAGK
jgi:hypothetical protein